MTGVLTGGGSINSNSFLDSYCSNMASALAGQVDNSGLSKRVLVLKIPRNTLQQLEDSCSKNNISKSYLLLSKHGNKEGEKLVVAVEAGRMEEKQLKFIPERPSMIVFSQLRDDETGQVKLEGTVERQGFVQTSLSGDYKLKQRKLQEQLKPNRVTNFLDEESLLYAHEDGLKPGQHWKATQAFEERKRKNVDDRRVVEAGNSEWKENCLLKLFQLFERKPRWSIRELNNEIQIPTSRLKTVVNEVCQIHRSGPLRGQYELKDEYKTKQQRDETAADAAALMEEIRASSTPGSIEDLMPVGKSRRYQ
ncbi:hypothetical protein Gasu2_14250 [Galdieria sulphuraria]|uniref:Transcription initiation factor IIF beta subunit (TFIIF-beta) family protein n=1 Tax=Galdieria sulphuraria TaxID=130081 RepID=M2XTN1_GALSU|nr:transcription initiation factor IIF beta subunit (TFIIF-beta) family protein [Galdieria sulphuraria]EME26769.1 transcription initiation factor IIF beta subunit (TFIIF-beta) family protein [Galdieria sulphuraria]GJD07042.1 hypothetical protein Gasu2_14250 [Galdieria sulphuraria]|eukprot:XP_005703289.1 transcription initiation factor IIF beta subunit (TFIIF-beta) family protein [Galdieria sulphuraria]